MNYSIVSKLAVTIGAGCLLFSTVPTYAQDGWTEPKPLNSYAFEDQDLLNESAPHIEYDGNGNWLAMWAHPNNTGLAFSHSHDTGATWGPDTQFDSTSLARTTSTLYVLDDATHLYTGNNTWVSVWSVERYHPSPNYRQLYTAFSTDNGTSWSVPVRLDLGGEITQLLTSLFDIQLAADGTGNVLGIFAARTGTGAKLDYFLIRSTDFGKSWSAPENLSIHADLPAYAYQVKIAYAGNNRWLLVSAVVPPDSTSIHEVLHKYYVSASVDMGNTWSLSGPVIQENDPIGQPRFSFFSTDDTAVIAWYNDQALGYAVIVSTDGGVTFSPPNWVERSVSLSYPSPLLSLAADEVGGWALAAQPRFGDTPPVIYTASDPATTWSKTAVTAGQNSEVDIAGGEAGEFVAVMTHINLEAPVMRTDADIAAVSTIDGGDNWSSPVLVNEFATTDSTQVDDSQVDLEAGSTAMLSTWITRSSTYQGPAATSFSRSDTRGFFWDTSSELAKVSSAAPQLVHIYASNWLVYWPTNGPAAGAISYSNDNGLTWSDPVALDSTRIASNGSGLIVRARAGGLFSRSLDGGHTWESEAQAANIGVRQILHTGGSNWLAVGTGSTILISADNGLTWLPHAGPPMTIQGVAASNTGVVLATSYTYEDGPASGDRTVHTYVSRSTNGGVTWSPQVLVHSQTRNATGIVAEFRGEPRPLWLGGDRWAVFPKNLLYIRHQPLDINHLRNMDIFFIESTDDGLTWGDAELIVERTGFDFTTGTDYEVLGNVVSVAYEMSGTLDFYDGDILYINKIIEGSAAATDWALFD